MRRLLWCLIFAVMAVGMEAAELGETFNKANTLYGDGKYSEAAAAYETAVANGGRTANLFYNLGNAYFRAGDLGRASLNFERALELDPGHREAEANLTLTRERIGVGQAKPSGFVAEYLSWPSRVTAEVLTVCAWAVFLAVGLLVMGTRRGLAIALLSVGLAGGGIGSFAYFKRGWDPADAAAAVVAGGGSPLRYAPAESAPASGNASGGSHARILSTSGEWLYCEVEGGARGWVQSQAVERFLPRQ